jgi:leader peptidase (prepilin peptidase)/N-methyltransferase
VADTAARLGLREQFSCARVAQMAAVALVTDVVLAVRLGPCADLPAYLYLGAVGAMLAVVGAATRRIPNPIVLGSYPATASLLALGSYLGHDWSALARAATGMTVVSGFFVLLAVAFPGGLGLGDAKLAGLYAMGLAWSGWPPLAAGMLGAWGIAALFVAVRRALTGRHGALPFAPFLLAGTLLAVSVAR